ncbi:NUDIX hydrolase [Arthrobacter celericrescens]|uniref:NUDIX hydrolase n=1 Tax=Arthrobacter celericrescens TaxID=2320851 RepID=UPI000EA043FA|nr:NUDIX domain-containing protein [Arthrobacter celericrescens]
MDFPGNDATTDLPLRLGGRVLLFDQQNRLLLMEDSDPADPGKGSWWITPGGGLEPGEDPAQAARRELLEETGLSIESVHGPVGTSEFVLTFQGVRTLQRDSFFHATLPAGTQAVKDVQFTTAERASLKGSRWWSLPEIESAEVPVLPAILADLVRLAHGATTAP